MAVAARWSPGWPRPSMRRVTLQAYDGDDNENNDDDNDDDNDGDTGVSPEPSIGGCHRSLQDTRRSPLQDEH